MPVAPIPEEELPGRVTNERIHVALPDRPPHHGRVIQVMPGHKVPVDVDGKECPIVWAESMGMSVDEAHAAFFAKAPSKVRTIIQPSPKKP